MDWSTISEYLSYNGGEWDSRQWRLLSTRSLPIYCHSKLFNRWLCIVPAFHMLFKLAIGNINDNLRIPSSQCATPLSHCTTSHYARFLQHYVNTCNIHSSSRENLITEQIVDEINFCYTHFMRIYLLCVQLFFGANLSTHY